MLLLDTNVVLRLILDSEKISSRAELAMVSARISGGGLAIAAITLWEIALLDAKKRIELNSTVESFLLKVETVFHVLPLTRQIAIRGNQFGKAYPKDPADKQIGATALVHGISLVTSDNKLRKSGEVPCIW